jgi:hypothetical protein
MRRAAVGLLALFASLHASGAGLGGLRTRKQGASPGWVNSGSSLAFSLLVGGAGQGSISSGATFYSTFSSQFTGTAAWFFDAQTATEKVGNFTFSAVGTPTTTTEKICNNGPDCTSTTVRLLSSANVYKSANTASPASDFSCVVISRADTGTTGDVLSKNGASILLREPTGGGTAAFINSGSFTAGSNTLPRAWNFYVLTYHKVAAGTSVGTTYFNSKSSTGSSSTLGLVSASNAPWVIGAFDTAGTTNPFTGRILYAGCSETIWSSATISAMYDAGIGALVDGQARALATTTRSGGLTCTNDSWATITTVPADRPCVASNALYLQVGSTNVALQSEDITTTTYTATNVTSTADTTASPDGTTTADTAQSTVAGGLLETTTGFLPTGSSTHVASIWVKTSASTQAVTFTLRDTTAGADVCTTSPTATTTWTRISCSGTAIAGNTLKLRIYPGGSGGTGTTIWWGAQVEAFLMTSYIRTTTASVVRGTQNFSVSLPTMRDSEGCIAATINATSNQLTSNAAVIGTGSNYAMHLPVNNTSVTANDGTSSVSKSGLTSFAGRSTPLLSIWFGASRTVAEVGVAAASGSYDGAFLASTTFYLGTDDNAGTNALQALLSDIKIGTSKDACQ